MIVTSEIDAQAFSGHFMATVAPMQPPVSPMDPAWVPSPLYRMSLGQYEALIASGAFTKRDRVQLKNGYPGSAGYASRQDFAAGQHVPLVIGGRQVGMIAFDDLLHW
jgi:hypothetical protein